MLTSITEKYEPAKMERIKKMLQIQQETGSKVCYSISIDDMEVLSKVENLELFDHYHDLIDSTTETIEVMIFSNDRSKLSKKFTFTMKEKPIIENNNTKPLGEIEIKEIITRHVDQERERWETQGLRDKLNEEKEKVAEAEEYIDKLLDAIDQMKGKADSEGSSFNEGLLNVLSVVKDFAPMFLKDKVNNQLTGSPESNESNATFKSKEEKPLESISNEDKQRLEKVYQREKTFTPEEQKKIDQIIDELSQEKGAIDVLIEGFRQSKEMQKPQ
jgi:hypothetical protein